MKLSRVVEVSLNGDAPTVDPAVRRTLYSVADAVDESTRQTREDMNEALLAVRSDYKQMRRLLIGTTTTVLGGVLVGIANILIQL